MVVPVCCLSGARLATPQTKVRLVPGSPFSLPSQVAPRDSGIYMQGWRKDLGYGYESTEPVGLELRALKISGLILTSSHTWLFHCALG